MESEDQPIDAALAAWERLRPLLAAACAHSGRRLAYRQPEEFGVLIREKEPPRALRLEYSPERKKLRYKAGASGWQELDAVERPQKPAAFETPHHQEYSVEEVCDLVLAELEKSPL